MNKLKQEQQTVKKLITQQQQEEAELNRQIDRLIAEELERARKAEEERQRQLAAERQRRERQQKEQQGKQVAINKGGSGKGGSKDSGKNDGKNGSRRPAGGKGKSGGEGTDTSSGTDSNYSYAKASPDHKLSGSFANNKGRLPIPITGRYRVVRNFGSYSMAGVTLQSNGLQLEGQSGAKARCVFDGEVSNVYNFGNNYFVMVRHGRYISVYGNLASVSVKKGQHVNINQSLGAVGNGNVLIFRLQDWNKVLNPKSWLSRL